MGTYMDAYIDIGRACTGLAVQEVEGRMPEELGITLLTYIDMHIDTDAVEERPSCLPTGCSGMNRPRLRVSTAPGCPSGWGCSQGTAAGCWTPWMSGSCLHTPSTSGVRTALL